MLGLKEHHLHGVGRAQAVLDEILEETTGSEVADLVRVTAKYHLLVREVYHQASDLGTGKPLGRHVIHYYTKQLKLPETVLRRDDVWPYQGAIG